MLLNKTNARSVQLDQSVRGTKYCRFRVMMANILPWVRLCAQIALQGINVPLKLQLRQTSANLEHILLENKANAQFVQLGLDVTQYLCFPVTQEKFHYQVTEFADITLQQNDPQLLIR